MTTQAFNLSQFANYLNSSGQVSASGLQSGVVLPSGTVSLYYQSSAPTGWTQITTLNDYALRIVSSSGGVTGGTTAFSTVFSNQTPSYSASLGTLAVGATTLSTSQMPNHSHSVYAVGGGGAAFTSPCGNNAYSPSNLSTDSQGGGGSHNHSLTGLPSATIGAITLNVRYANIILCSKN